MNTFPVILGPTASGKSSLALALARHLNAELISVDSMKVYRGMDIGTAKPSPAEQEEIKHHLIDIRNVDQPYSAHEFYEDCCAILKSAEAEGKPVILEGGTSQYFWHLFQGLFVGPKADWALRERLETEAAASTDVNYLHDILKACDPESAERLHPHDMRRIIRAIEVHHITGKPLSHLQETSTRPAPFNFKVVGLQWPRELLYERINSRVEQMIEMGLLDEVKQLSTDYSLSRQALQGLGYKEIIDFINGKHDWDRAVELVKQSSRRFAKHQITWFRGWGQIHWLDAENKSSDDMLEASLSFLSK